MLNIKNISRRLLRARAWSKTLTPFVRRTLTLQRPLANGQLRRATRCGGLDEDFALPVNGHRQWLRIRGHCRNNPLILYLHGGPGGSQIPSYRRYQLGWEKHFTMVHWEQRGAGRSYTRRLDAATMTIPQLAADALAVLDYLSSRFNRRDIILLGHSWGTLLSIHVLQARPDNISAYVGVGQIANQIESERRMYRFVIRRAAAAGNRQVLSKLAGLADYPLQGASPANVGLVRYWARHYGFLGSRTDDDARNHARLMQTPEYGVRDVYRYLQGSLLCARTLGKDMFTNPGVQPEQLPKKFAVPLFLISGRRDHFTPADMADTYLQSVAAPATGHVVFDDSGHYPNEDDPHRFLRTLQTLVQPYLDSGGG